METLKHSRRKHRERGKSNSLPLLFWLRASSFIFYRMEDMNEDDVPVVLEDMKSFFEDCYPEWNAHGVRRPNWADPGVLVDLSLLNPLITKDNVEAFYKSCVQQMEQQTIVGKQNILIFQCDSRSPGTIQSSDEELRQSFMFFHNYVKYRGLELGYFLFFDANEFPQVSVFWTKALCLYLLHILLPQFLVIYLDSDAVLFDQLFVNLRQDVNPPCIVSASEYAGMHNAGFY